MVTPVRPKAYRIRPPYWVEKLASDGYHIYRLCEYLPPASRSCWHMPERHKTPYKRWLQLYSTELFRRYRKAWSRGDTGHIVGYTRQWRGYWWGCCFGKGWWHLPKDWSWRCQRNPLPTKRWPAYINFMNKKAAADSSEVGLPRKESDSIPFAPYKLIQLHYFDTLQLGSAVLFSSRRHCTKSMNKQSEKQRSRKPYYVNIYS